MVTGEMDHYFSCKYVKELDAWRYTAYDKVGHEVKHLKVKVKIKKDGLTYDGMAYAFYSNNDDCWFIDILTGKKKIFKNYYSYELGRSQ